MPAVRSPLAPADLLGGRHGRGSSNSTSPEGTAADTWWKLLYQNGADIVLNGHDHLYARFIPLDPNANPDRAERNCVSSSSAPGANLWISLRRDTTSADTFAASTGYYFGVMKLTLHRDGYEWDYKSAMKDPAAPANTPANFSDAGKGSCQFADRDRF